MSRRKFQTNFCSLLLFSFFSAFLFIPNVIAQQGKLVEALDIQGNRRLRDEDLLKHIKTRPGERLDERRVQDDLQSLFKLGLFNLTQTRVTIEPGMRGGVHVIFEVMELPLIAGVEFKDLRYFTKDELLTELRAKGALIEKDMPYDLIKTRNALRILEKYLKERGFADAEVCVLEEQVSATAVKISFEIDELPGDDEEYYEN